MPRPPGSRSPVLDTDAFASVAAPVLRRVQLWVWILGFPLYGAYWFKLLDTRFAGLAIVTLGLIGVGAVIFVLVRREDVRIWVTAVLLFTTLSASWLAFGPRFGSGVSTLLFMMWAAVMLGARESFLAFVLMLISYTMAAWLVTKGIVQEPLQPGLRDPRAWLEIGLPAFVAALVGSRFLVLVGDALSRSWNRERASLREAAEGRAQLVDTRAALELAQRRAMVGVLASGYAHDVNNLLTALRMNLDLLAGAAQAAEIDVPELVAAMERASEGARHMFALGRVAAANERTGSVRTVVERIPRMLRPVLARNVRVEVAGAVDAAVPLGEARLEQILLNLAINAGDAMPDGGTVTIAVDVADREVTLRVDDTGSGIAPEVLARVFDPFFTTKAATEGSGLGLAMVKQIAEDAGGRVTIESAVGRGTRVTATIPRAA